jgi:hypothetical protein
MGDIVFGKVDEIFLQVEAATSAPIERLDFFNGKQLIGTWRPYDRQDLGRRIRVLWGGAEYRGRARMSTWDGTAKLTANAFSEVTPINFFSRDKQLHCVKLDELAWESVTTGSFAGFDALLEKPTMGNLLIATKSGALETPLDRVALEEHRIDCGGLDKHISVYRLPDENRCHCAKTALKIPLESGRDNPLYVRLTTEDGHCAWSSPIYVVPKPGWLLTD